MSKKNKPVLGRGLNLMLGGQSTTLENTEARASSMATLSLELIIPNANQPRQKFTDDSLNELADSIKHLGIIQPITVRPESDGNYLIISGERRYKAAKLAGLKEVPVYIRSTQEGELLELALVENIQREDLNPIEIALSYQRLLEQTGVTQESLAQRVGKKRSTISNYMRLLQLPSQIQLGLRDGNLDMGHARALLQVRDPERQRELYELILCQALSVREVEDLARALNSPDEGESENKPGKARPKDLPREYHLLEQHLAKVFATKVSLSCSKLGKGKISIPFTNEEELERIMLLLEKIQQD